MNPAIKNWIQWWDDRRSHIFTPYRGGGPPGVNLSEQGNAGWVTCQMQLVHAAKYDVSTMMTQEKQVFKFDRNLEKSTGHGLTQAVHASHARSEQVTIGEEFVEIISDEEATEEEARQDWEPAGFTPKKKCKHILKQVKLVQEESTQKKLTTKPVASKDQKSRKCKAPEETNQEVEESKEESNVEASTQARNNLPNHSAQMNKKLQILFKDQSTEKQHAQPATVGQPAQPATFGWPAQPATVGQPAQVSNPEIERYWVPNPPIVILTTGTNIRMCKGCGKAITWNDKQYPHNMVFTRRGITGYLNRKSNTYINKISNIHFHLKIKCIREHDCTVKLHEIMMNEEVFADLSTEQIEELNKRGILKYITDNTEI